LPVNGIYRTKRNFTCGYQRAPQTDFSRFEALVRKRESLLKFIYERRKGEGCSGLGRNRGPFSWPSLHFKLKKRRRTSGEQVKT
jgi:hypothetical protein